MTGGPAAAGTRWVAELLPTPPRPAFSSSYGRRRYTTLAHQIGAALTAGAVLLALALIVVALLIVRRPSVADEPAPVPTDIARLTSR